MNNVCSKTLFKLLIQHCLTIDHNCSNIVQQSTIIFCCLAPKSHSLPTPPRPPFPFVNYSVLTYTNLKVIEWFFNISIKTISAFVTLNSCGVMFTINADTTADISIVSTGRRMVVAIALCIGNTNVLLEDNIHEIKGMICEFLKIHNLLYFQY